MRGEGWGGEGRGAPQLSDNCSSHAVVGGAWSGVAVITIATMTPVIMVVMRGNN